MEFGRFGFLRNRSWLVVCLVLLCGSEFKAWAQQEAASSPAGSTVRACLSPKLRSEALGQAVTLRNLLRAGPRPALFPRLRRIRRCRSWVPEI